MNQSEKQLLPAWFAERMMEDSWTFGLLTTTGVVICIQRIISINQATDGSIWLDVELTPDDVDPVAELAMLCSPTSRTKASINSSHVVAAFELSDT